MKQPMIKNIKKAKAVFGVVTAIFSLALAVQQIVQLKKGQTIQA